MVVLIWRQGWDSNPRATEDSGLAVQWYRPPNRPCHVRERSFFKEDP